MSDSETGVKSDKPWKNSELMHRLHEEQDYTYAEMAELFGCTPSTVSSWMKRHQAEELREGLDVAIPDDKPYRDEELLRALYVDEELSTTEIAAVLDCSSSVVSKWMEKHGIDRRDLSDAVSLSRGGSKGIYVFTHGTKGYVHVKSGDDLTVLHKLQAVAYWGFDALYGMHVHHKNGIRWDNRRENLELMDASEHLSMHTKLDWLEQLRAAEMYREGASSYDLAPTFDVSPGTIIRAVRGVKPALIRDKTEGGAA